MLPDSSSKKRLIGTREEIVRFVLNGVAGSTVFYGIYLLIYRVSVVTAHNSAFSWAVAYVMAAWFTHQLHRKNTFRWETRYWESLRRTYAVYIAALLCSTSLQELFTYHLHWDHNAAFLVTLTTTGCFNYLSLRHWGFRGAEAA